jgi:RNA polymerase sigma-70 factor (ECF subfamily)
VQGNEADWLAQAQRGDPEAFTNLLEMYQKPVFNLCYRMLQNAGDAEDAAQETFLRAYKSIKRYDKSRPFATWLLSIAAHYCIDQLRKQRMTIISMEDTPYIEVVDSSPSPEASLSRRQEQERVRGLLDSLSPVDRAAVIMYYWNDISYKEIGQALDLTESAVKSRLHRARRSMAQAWFEEQKQIQKMERNRHGEIQSPAF